MERENFGKILIPRGSTVYRWSNLPLTAMLSGLLGDNGGQRRKVKGCSGRAPHLSLFHCCRKQARFADNVASLPDMCQPPSSDFHAFLSIWDDNPLERERERENIAEDRWPLASVLVHVTIIFPTRIPEIDNLFPVCGRRACIAYRRKRL